MALAALCRSAGAVVWAASTARAPGPSLSAACQQWQVLISKARAVIDGRVQLQTSAIISFPTPAGAMLALRLAGMKNAFTVPLHDESNAQARLTHAPRPILPHLAAPLSLRPRQPTGGCGSLAVPGWRLRRWGQCS